jgi:hypothetical protein
VYAGSPYTPAKTALPRARRSFGASLVKPNIALIGFDFVVDIDSPWFSFTFSSGCPRYCAASDAFLYGMAPANAIYACPSIWMNDLRFKVLLDAEFISRFFWKVPKNQTCIWDLHDSEGTALVALPWKCSPFKDLSGDLENRLILEPAFKDRGKPKFFFGNRPPWDFFMRTFPDFSGNFSENQPRTAFLPL